MLAASLFLRLVWPDTTSLIEAALLKPDGGEKKLGATETLSILLVSRLISRLPLFCMPVMKSAVP